MRIIDDSSVSWVMIERDRYYAGASERYYYADTGDSLCAP